MFGMRSGCLTDAALVRTAACATGCRGTARSWRSTITPASVSNARCRRMRRRAARFDDYGQDLQPCIPDRICKPDQFALAGAILANPVRNLMHKSCQSDNLTGAPGNRSSRFRVETSRSRRVRCSSLALRALRFAAARNLRKSSYAKCYGGQGDQLKVGCFKKPFHTGRLFDIITSIKGIE